MEERISGIEGQRKEMFTSVKDNDITKKPRHKIARKSGTL